MSPAIGRDRENGHGSISGTLAGGQGNGTARDSFLNYFFGKEGSLPAAGPPLPQPSQLGSRHVSHPIEPSFSQSVRRAERGSLAERSPLPQFGVTHDEYNALQYDGDVSLFVSSFHPWIVRHFPSCIVTDKVEPARTERGTPTHRPRSIRNRVDPASHLIIFQHRA